MTTLTLPSAKQTTQQNVIRFWNVLEYLAPFDLQRALSESLRYFRLDAGCRQADFPWVNPAVLASLKLSRAKNYRYTIYFGAFETVEAVVALRRLFGVDPPTYSQPPPKVTCFGSFRVGGDGYPQPESLSLSALPWALGRLGSGDVRAKLRDPRWSESFGAYHNGLYRQFFEGADLRERIVRPFDAEFLLDLCGAARRAAGWEPKLSPLAYCVIEEDKSERSPESPDEHAGEPDEGVGVDETEQSEAGENAPQGEATILNSFYVQDLERVFQALADGDIGVALDRYLDEGEPPDRRDLLERRNLPEPCAPGLLPPGRWASDDEEYQSLMQQAAINLTRSTLADGGMFSVNGPPGTGKTTMLRDVIADIVVRRAERLAEFATPGRAFTGGGEMSPASGGVYRFYKLNPRLAGFEIVVASSNNGAVENVTREIPGAKAVGADYLRRLRYFTEVAQNCLGPDDEGRPPWGLMAAVLGNSRNRYEFARKFWFGPKKKGRQHSSEQPAYMTFKRHLNERATGVGAGEWQRAKDDFRAARGRVAELLAARERWAQAVSSERALKAKLREAEERSREAGRDYEDAAEEVRRAARAVEEAEKALCDQMEVIKAISHGKPGGFLFFVHSLLPFLRIEKVAQYEARMGEAQRELDGIREQLKQRKPAHERAQERLEQCRLRHASASNEVYSLTPDYEEAVITVEEGKRQLGEDTFADEAWWARDESRVQMRAPWLDSELNEARAELFLSALRLHQTFVEAARDPFRRNLSLWADLVTGNLQGKPEQVLELWRTFFLVVPVVSTTFASFGRMFGALGRESLGWLLIDEAGQATPQAAVGALWRARRAVVVGDPLQIEPVVALEDPIINRLAEHFGLSSHWRPASVASGASVQKLADHVNPYGGLIGEGGEALWVGCPLRVHRRCANPMFDISNHIAYNGIMIKASGDAPPGGDERLGRSRWVGVGGNCEGKNWVPEQGRQVLAMLAEKKSRGGKLPKVFVISPFRNVAYQLTQLLEEERGLWAPDSAADWEVSRWLSQSVGTVHTFQGKEAPTVILILGTDASSGGARRWASGKPNILNVAATRAQKNFYVIGDDGLWGNLPHFDVAAEFLKQYALGAI